MHDKNSSVESLSDGEGAVASHTRRHSVISLPSGNMLGLLEDAPHTSDFSAYCGSVEHEGSPRPEARGEEGSEHDEGQRPARLEQPPSARLSSHSGSSSASASETTWNHQNIRFLDPYGIQPSSTMFPSQSSNVSSAPTTTSSPLSPTVPLPTLSHINVQAVLQTLLTERAKVDLEAEARLRARLAQVNQRAKEQVSWAQNAEIWARKTAQDFKRRLDVINAKEVELQKRELQVAQAWAKLQTGEGAATTTTAAAAVAATESSEAASAARERARTSAAPWLAVQAQAPSPHAPTTPPHSAPLSVEEKEEEEATQLKTSIEGAKVKGRKPRSATTAAAGSGAKSGSRRTIKESIGVRKTAVRKTQSDASFFPKPVPAPAPAAAQALDGVP